MALSSPLEMHFVVVEEWCCVDRSSVNSTTDLVAHWSVVGRFQAAPTTAVSQSDRVQLLRNLFCRRRQPREGASGRKHWLVRKFHSRLEWNRKAKLFLPFERASENGDAGSACMRFELIGPWMWQGKARQDSYGLLLVFRPLCDVYPSDVDWIMLPWQHPLPSPTSCLFPSTLRSLDSAISPSLNLFLRLVCCMGAAAADRAKLRRSPSARDLQGTARSWKVKRILERFNWRQMHCRRVAQKKDLPQSSSIFSHFRSPTH